jgi:hypothetical protein
MELVVQHLLIRLDLNARLHRLHTRRSEPGSSCKYRSALVMSSMVTFIAGYHYFRIFNSFNESSMKNAIAIGTSQGTFNEAYRYV